MTDLGAVDVHVLRVGVALPHVGPVLAVLVVVHALVAALIVVHDSCDSLYDSLVTAYLVARHRAVGQHPARILLALVGAGPVGAVLVADRK